MYKRFVLLSNVHNACAIYFYICIPRVRDQHGISMLYNILEIHHSGPGPSKFCSAQLSILHGKVLKK